MQGHLDIVRELCDKGVDVNEISNSFETALMVATEYNHSDIVEELVKRGALDFLEDEPNFEYQEQMDFEEQD
jgi:ankyrin repeat protein